MACGFKEENLELDLSEKPKNAIKIKIGCVVIKLRVLKLNPDHL